MNDQEKAQAIKSLRDAAADDMAKAAAARDFQAMESAQSAITALNVLARHFGIS